MDQKQIDLWRQADALLDQLLQLPEAQRKAFLDAQQPLPAVRRRVEKLLRAAETEAMLDRPLSPERVPGPLAC